VGNESDAAIPKFKNDKSLNAEAQSMGTLLLKAVGGPFTENLYDEIEGITDSAELDVDLIDYDEEARKVVIPLTRLPIVPGQKKVFRKVTPYKRDKHRKIPCVVTIKNVTGFSMETCFEEDRERQVNLLFGVVFKENRIIITSVQESRGKHLLEVEIAIDSLDIEIRDV
jgi:hypothetical protein